MQAFTELEWEDIWARMQFSEMEYDRAYPNPAQRFVESVKITAWQRKQPFRIRYGGIGYYGDEVLFHAVHDEDLLCNVENISVLKIEEAEADFILAVVEDFYPYYYYDRQYLSPNHLPAQMWEKILERVREVRRLLLEDPADPALQPYIERFPRYVFVDFDKPDWWECLEKKSKTQLCLENRYTIAALYDVFIRWSEAQLHIYWGAKDDLMFNIQGP